MTEYTFGSDVEFPLYHGDKLVPAFDVTDAAKGAVADAEGDILKGFGYHWDNVAFEVNSPVAHSMAEFISTHLLLHDNLGDLTSFNPSFTGLRLGTESSVVLPENILVRPEAGIFGCDPDESAWLKKDELDSIGKGDKRFFGGHIHIGIDPLPSKKELMRLVRLLDKYVGVGLVLVSNDDPDRRKYYGSAGRFRIKPYGIEYRSPSNFWMSSPSTIIWVANAIQEALAMQDKFKMVYPNAVSAKKVIHAINKADRLLASTVAPKSKRPTVLDGAQIDRYRAGGSGNSQEWGYFSGPPKMKKVEVSSVAAYFNAEYPPPVPLESEEVYDDIEEGHAEPF